MRLFYRYILVLILFFFSLSLCMASPIDEETATEAFSNWLSQVENAPMETNINFARISSVEPLVQEDGNILYYVIQLEAGGFAVLSADDEIYPIVAFSPEGYFDVQDQGSTLAVMLRGDLEAAQERALARQTRGETPRENEEAKSAWNALLSRQTRGGISFVSDVRVAPLLSSKWSQSYACGRAVYNYYTPYNSVCGCVATAGAQIMRYHEYPKTAVPNTKFKVTFNKQPIWWSTIGGTYNWDQMPLEPAKGVTETQAKEIGKLCNDAGVACHMFYTVSSSGSWTYTMVEALTGYFGYASAVSVFASNTTIEESILTNLDARLPVHLSIQSNSGGHAIVGDGYGYHGGQLYVHLNMGWSGTDDTWYHLPYVNTSVGYNFTTLQCVGCNIDPWDECEIVSGRIFDRNGKLYTGKASVVAIEPKTGKTVATTFSDAKGIYAVKLPRPDYGKTHTYTLCARGDNYVGTSTVTIKASRSVQVRGINFSSGGIELSYSGNQLGNLWGKDICLDTNSVVITFHPEGGIMDMTQKAYRIGDYFDNNLPVPERPGYVFRNWYYTVNGKVIEVYDTLNLTRVNEKMTDFYANWEEDNTDERYFSYELQKNGTYKIVGTKDIYYPRGDLMIPSSHDGKRVTAIGSSLFASNLLAYGCYDTVYVPDGITSLDSGAFEWLPAKRLVIGTGVTSIPECFVANAQALEEVRMSGKVTSIGVHAFAFCNNLQRIELPDTVESIGDEAFSKDSSLESIVLPASVVSLGASVFTFCESLHTVSVANGNQKYSSLNGVLYNKAKTELYLYPPAKTGSSYVTPSSVETIKQSALSECVNLTSLQLSSGLKTVESYGISGLKLDRLDLPEGLEKLDDWAIQYNTLSEGTVIIPASLKSIGRQAIYYNSGLQRIVVAEQNQYFSSWQGLLMDKGLSRLILCPSFCPLKTLELPGTVEEIAEYAFLDCKYLTEIKLPPDLRTIGEGAFEACVELTSIEFPESITALPDDVLANTSKLTSVVFPESLEKIGEGAFEFCDALKSLTIPAAVKSIGEDLIKFCDSLTELHFKGVPPTVTGDGEICYYKDCSKITIHAPAGKGWGSTFCGCNVVLDESTATTLPDNPVSRKLSATAVADGDKITVTLFIQSSSMMNSLNLYEILPAGWKVVTNSSGATTSKVGDRVKLSYCYSKGSIPSSVTYTMSCEDISSASTIFDASSGNFVSTTGVEKEFSVPQSALQHLLDVEIVGKSVLCSNESSSYAFWTSESTSASTRNQTTSATWALSGNNEVFKVDENGLVQVGELLEQTSFELFGELYIDGNSYTRSVTVTALPNMQVDPNGYVKRILPDCCAGNEDFTITYEVDFSKLSSANGFALTEYLPSGVSFKKVVSGIDASQVLYDESNHTLCLLSYEDVSSRKIVVTMTASADMTADQLEFCGVLEYCAGIGLDQFHLLLAGDSTMDFLHCTDTKMELSLKTGWQFLGIHFLPDEVSWNRLLEISDGIWIWDGTKFVAAESRNQLAGRGVVLRLKDARRCELSGTAIEEGLQLNSGWNLVPARMCAKLAGPMYLHYSGRGYVQSEELPAAPEAIWYYQQ